MTSGVLFIAGWGRSGSTLLDRLLGQMDGVVSLGEMRDIWRRGVVENRLCGCGRPFRECPFWSSVGERAFGGWTSLDLDRVEQLRRTVDRPWMLPFLVQPRLAPARLRRQVESYVALVARLYAGIEDVTGGRMVVDSTKIPTWSLLLRLAGVRQRVLHLVRDSRGVIYSWRKQVVRPDATGEADEMLRYGPVTGSVRYTLYNAMTHVLQLVRLPYQRVRYEDLVADPAGLLRRVAPAAGLPLDPQVLAALDAGTCVLHPTHTVDGNPSRFATGVVRLRVDDTWRRELPWQARTVTTVLTAPLLRAYGYSDDDKAAGQLAATGGRP